MHVSLPESQQADHRGREYTTYSFYVGTIFHSSWRYSELDRLHQVLAKQFPAKEFPPFPPKRWRTLNGEELQQRRIGLETYLQTLFHDESIIRNEYFQEAFIHQQVASNSDCVSGPCRVSVYFMDGSCMELDFLSTSSTSWMRHSMCERCGIDSQFSAYFDLFLAIESRDQDGEPLFSLTRKLEDFEAPFVTVRTLRRSCSKAVILFRKRFWDVTYDRELLASQRDAIRWLLFVEAAHATRNGWIDDAQVRSYLSSIRAQCTNSTNGTSYSQAASASKPCKDGAEAPNGHSVAFGCQFDASFRNQAIRFLALCRKSRFWNSMRFHNCRVRLAHSQTGEQREITADVSVGPREIVFLLHDNDVMSNNDRQQRPSAPSTPLSPPYLPTTNFGSSRELEMVFRIPRIRCWRIQSTKEEGGSPSRLRRGYSFSFEYLFSEGNLSWITVLHEDVLFLKSCLQEIVDELQSRQVRGENRYAIIELGNAGDVQPIVNAAIDNSSPHETGAVFQQNLPSTTIDSGQEIHATQLEGGSKNQSDSAVSISASTSSSSVSMPDSLTSNAQTNGHTHSQADSRSVMTEQSNVQHGHAGDERDATTRAHRHTKSVTSQTLLSNVSEPTMISIELSRRRSSSASGSLNPLFRRLSFMTNSSRTSRVSDVFEAVGDDEL